MSIRIHAVLLAFDPATISAIIGMHLKTNWGHEIEYVHQNGRTNGCGWEHTDTPTSVKGIREIDQAAMKLDLFQTLKSKPAPVQHAAL
jgi:hypothetical protein